jgi:hypothetical protein
MDGTSMLFTAHYSREHQSDWGKAYLGSELSAQLIKDFNLDVNDEEGGYVFNPNPNPDLNIYIFILLLRCLILNTLLNTLL